MTMLDGSYDYIICGGGTAGCVLANRLSADPSKKVLLLEAGGKDSWIGFHVPVGYLYAIHNPRADWMYKTEAEAGLNGRSLIYPRGKVIGGCSAINGMIVMRGQAGDYDHWRQLGLAGWGWDDVQPLFRSIEDHFLGDSDEHQTGGEWRVERQRLAWDVLEKVADAAEQMGIPRTDDPNTGDNEGICYFHVNQKRGLRWSAARGFLKPVRKRSNLRVITHATIEKLVMEGRRVTGVAFNGQVARCNGEVVLAAGAIGSPLILERSGIGQAERLKSHGITPLLDVAGVGANLQDHLQLRMIYRISGIKTLNDRYRSLFGRTLMGLDYLIRQRGPLSMAPSQLGIFTRSDKAQERANIEYHVQPLSLDAFGQPLHDFPALTVSVCNLRPTSVGSSHLRSNEVHDAPAIRPNYLATEADKHVAIQSLRHARRLMDQAALKPYQPHEYRPGPSVDDSDEALLKAAGDIGTTIFHPVGTAKMGVPSDKMAVVDGRLKLFGLENLRVIDASIMPTLTSGNTATPVVMIAEKGSRMMIEDAK